MPYFIIMIGFSAYGIVTAYNFFEKKSKGKKIAELIFYPNLINAAGEEKHPTIEEANDKTADDRSQEVVVAAEEKSSSELLEESAAQSPSDFQENLPSAPNADE